jgi:DNA processing protein
MMLFSEQTSSPVTPQTAIYPLREIVAYEALWADKNTTFTTLANLFAKNPNKRPSDLVKRELMDYLTSEIKKIFFYSNKPYKANILIKGTFDFPIEKLKDAKEPVELLYYSGDLNYLNTRCISIVGTRKPTEDGLKAVSEITQNLVRDNFTIVSGLAEGIDTKAHITALENNGRTIAVLGTPLNKTYPKQNEELQNTIAKEHLLISQVPFLRYSKQDYRINRLFFLERNKTMSALSEATLIIEAGETSGSLTQATAALYQKRKLLIWEKCFTNKEITWPKRFLEKGAIRVGNYDEIRNALENN